MSRRGFLDIVQLLGAFSSVARKNVQLHSKHLDLTFKNSGTGRHRNLQIPKSEASIPYQSVQRTTTTSSHNGYSSRSYESIPQPTSQGRPVERNGQLNLTGEQAGHNVIQPIALGEARDPHLTSLQPLKSRNVNDAVSIFAESERNRSTNQPSTEKTDIKLTDHLSNPLFNDLAAEHEENTSDEALFSDLIRSPKALKSLQSRKTPEISRYSQPEPQQTVTSKSEPRIPQSVTTTTPAGAKITDDRVPDVAASTQAALISSQNQSGLHQAARETSGSQYKLKESKVPSTRLGRFWQYGGLATSMAFGAVGETFRRATGSTDAPAGSVMLSGANMERLVSKLSRMRGAALKLGQMISFQDLKMLPGPIQEVLQRVQDSADFMPAWQRDKVLVSNLGSDWKDLFSSFDEIPMAAASIGQVHGAVLKKDGMRVAVKIQYPGVAASIDSDLKNLSTLLVVSSLLPKGLYLDKTIENSRTELAWECDYEREGKAAQRFSELLKDDTDTFVVPRVITEASSSQVLTLERMGGTAVTKIPDLSQEQRDWIASNILRLCLRELIEFQFMQTDPNWTNFLYNSTINKIELLDFGASREYPARFVEAYTGILQAAARQDRATIVDLSVQLGYLTGHESRAMREAHTDSVLTLAEPFADNGPDCYDFQDQTITDRVRALIPVMLRERLAPPPEETYSLHRKLSGAFLLCARLGSRVRAKEMFRDAVQAASKT